MIGRILSFRNCDPMAYRRARCRHEPVKGGSPRGAISAILAIFVLAAWVARADSAKPCPDVIGKVELRMEAGDTGKRTMKPGELQAFRRNLQRLRDAILAQPVFHPLRGADLRGHLRPVENTWCGDNLCRYSPIAAMGYLYILDYRLWDSGCGLVVEASVHARVRVNNAIPDSTPLTNDRSRKMFIDPPRLPDLQGFPFYAISWGSRTLVLTPSRKPLWIPVTQEQFLNAKIRDAEAGMAEAPKISLDPAGDAYRDWVAGRAQRERDAQKAHDDLMQINPRAAEEVLRRSREAEQQATEGLKKNMERNPPARHLTERDYYEQRIALHKAALAAMTPADRRLQARYLESPDGTAPELAPARSDQGKPVVTPNPDFFDPSLPGSAIQVVTIDFDGLNVDPSQETFDPVEELPYQRLRDLERGSDWKAVFEAVFGR